MVEVDCPLNVVSILEPQLDDTCRSRDGRMNGDGCKSYCRGGLVSVAVTMSVPVPLMDVGIPVTERAVSSGSIREAGSPVVVKLVSVI